MRIEYSLHLLERLKLRGIEDDLPAVICESATERFEDMDTGHLIAVSSTTLYGKDRDVMVAYRVFEDHVKLLTIHPLKEGQKQQRINSGRWRRL